MVSDQSFKSDCEFIKTNVNLILVHGKAHSGKGEVAKYLVEEHGFTEFGFADYLKELATDCFDWPSELIYNNSKRTAGSRSFMQAIGHAGRIVNEDFWVKYLANKIWAFCMTKPCTKRVNIVISDLRYPNEMDWGRLVGGHIWKVVRTGDFKKIQSGEGHASEISLDDRTDWDAILVNDSTLDIFYEKVSQALSR